MATQVLAADKIVIYAQELGSGLQESIEALHPESEIECTAFNLEEWMRQFASNYSVGGIVLDTDSMGLGDLRTVAATIKLKPEVWCLMLVGDRGIAGFENFIELNNVLMLPKPWTPQGLRSCLANFYKSESGKDTAETNSEFLGGLVEGLRDPITCISGGLQMVKMGGDGAVEFIEPALRAALQISEQLQYVELASTDVTPHFDSIDLSDCANSIKKDLSKLGYDFKIKVTKGIRVYSEPSFAAASLKACFLLLHRFGLQGDITLVSDSIDSKPCLIWEQKNSGELAASSLSPPPYLQELITKLSDKAETTVVIDKIKDIVPTRAGLIFNK